MTCCGGVARDNSSANIQTIGGIARIEKELDEFRAKNRMIDAIKSHKIAVDMAMRTGDMSQVRQVNEEYYNKEISEIQHSKGYMDG
jgi:wyosine [tRNA(Phe)-imidazoG37] synthetase (radical SAM superfamily)